MSQPTRRPIIRTWGQYGGLCDCCGEPNDPYMVKFDLWRRVIPKAQWRDLICLDCFELRLGRELEWADFIHDKNQFGDPCPINYGHFGFHVAEFLQTRGNV